MNPVRNSKKSVASRSVQTSENLVISNGVKSFSEKVKAIVRKIPKGNTMTYKQVATKAGNPKAARAVGAIMRMNYDEGIPCHRVVKSDGSLGSYNRGGAEVKRKRLVSEGAL